MENPSKLVALLEQDFEEAKNADFQDIRETLMAGLNWETHYWVDCALKWIGQGAAIDIEIVNRLEEISSNKRYPQRTRHEAFKFAKRWQRANHT